jgi:hypothetical protein
MYNGDICGGIERGSCMDVLTDDNVCDAQYQTSLWWFANYYEKACVCNDRFVGVACERCFPGWTGDNCTEVLELSVRRNFAKLSTTEKVVTHSSESLSYVDTTLIFDDVLCVA